MALEPGLRFQRAAEFKTALLAASAPVRPEAPLFVAPAGPANYRQQYPVTPAASPGFGSIPAAAPVAHPTPIEPAPISPSTSRTAIGAGLLILVGICMLFILGGIIAGIYLQQQNRQNTENTAVAQKQGTQTGEARQTSTAVAMLDLNLTATAGQAALQTAQAEQTLTAIAQLTADAQAALQATEQALEATELALKSYQATIQAGRSLVFGPEDGTLEHDSEDGFIAGTGAGVNISDFEAEALFYNPYSPSQGSWDYGFIFRSVEANQQMRLVIQSSGEWELFNNTGDADGALIQDGELTSFNTEEDGANRVRLICTGSEGKFFVNDVFVAELDLSSRLSAGEIYIVTGIYSGNEVDGEFTPYRDFTIWSIP
jgi:hypothetical protein